MYSVWTKHLKDEKDIIDFKNELLGSRRVLRRLEDLIKEEKDALESSELSHKIYETPNWDYKIAHTNGFKAALKMVQKLINLDQKDK